jgi:hypothetical protein
MLRPRCTSALLFTLLLAATAGNAQVVQPELPGTDGVVLNIERSGNTVVMSGGFERVGRVLGGCVSLDLQTGRTTPDFPRVDGDVTALIPDGSGGWFLGGFFTRVGSLPRAGLAHVLRTGEVADWSPRVKGWVSVLALRENLLYIGGSFTEIDGVSRNNAAAVDIRTSAITNWNPDATGGPGASGPAVGVIVPQGNTVFVGGWFSRIGGADRTCIAELDAETGRATSWRGDVIGLVRAIVVHGNTVFVGGDFTQAGGQPRERVAELDARTGHVTAWNPGVGISRTEYGGHDEYVATLRLVGSTLYVGGLFRRAGGQPRGSLAALDTKTGAPTEWNPNPVENEYPRIPTIAAMAVRGRNLYVAGEFSQIGEQFRYNVAALDLGSGVATDWVPRGSNWVSALALDQGVVLAAGVGAAVWDWQLRNRVAAFDAITGHLLPFDPGANSYFDGPPAIAVQGNTVYLGGAFRYVDGQPRGCLAAVDLETGSLLDWNPLPPVGGEIHTLLVHGNRLFAEGAFSLAGETPSFRVAAFDTRSNGPPVWSSAANDFAYSLLLRGDQLYVGGWFNRLGGLPRKGLGALNAETGAIADWDPALDRGTLVFDLESVGNRVFATGSLYQRGAPHPVSLLGFDAVTGEQTSFDPHPVGDAKTLATDGRWLYAGGSFSSIGGQSRAYLAQLDPVTGEATSWDSGVYGYVESVLPFGNTTYVGGYIGTFQGRSCANIVALKSEGVVASGDMVDLRQGPVSMGSLECLPNPATARTMIRFAMPSPGLAQLTVYDVRGRKMQTVLDGATLAAGTHQFPLDTRTWSPGVYLYRLEVGGAVTTRKLLVVR